MIFKSLALTAIAAAAIAAPAIASPRTHDADAGSFVGFNVDMTPEQQARLQARLDALDVRLANLDVEVQARVQRAMQRADVKTHIAQARAEAHAEAAQQHAAVITARFSPERIRAITDRAMANAHAGAVASEAVARAMASIQPQIDALTNMDWNVDVQVDD